MKTNDRWPVEWVTFFDEYAGNFHPTFREKLAEQLWENASVETGIPGFEKYNFMLLIGQDYLEPEESDGYMFVKVGFIAPPAYRLDVWIYWGAEGKDITTLHTKNVSRINVEFHWAEDFPLEEVFANIKPNKKGKKEKTGLSFDVEYYHNAFPDMDIEFVFAKAPGKKQIEEIDNIINDFINKWNDKAGDEMVYFIGTLMKKERNVYTLGADFGVHTPVKIIDSLLKALSARVKPEVISRIKVK